MSAVAPSRALSSPGAWRGELFGALNATAAMLPFVLSYGFIAYGALGPEAAQVGLTASVIAVVLGGAAMAAAGRSRLPGGAPSASLCLIVASTVSALVRDPALQAAASTGLLVAAVSLVVAGAGVLTMLLGVLKAGSLVRFVPHPVLAGLMNGVAALLVISQLDPLLGLEAGELRRQGLRALAEWQPLALAVGGATVLLMTVAARRWPRAPAPFLALAIAGVAVGVWQAHAAPGSLAAALHRIGEVSLHMPSPDALLPLADAQSWPLLARQTTTLAFNAALLAVILSLESVLNLSAIEQRLQAERSDPDRELLAVGAANVFSGLFGGLPLVCMRLRALATHSGGGRTRVAIWLGCALLALAFTVGRPLVQWLSTAVIAGVLVGLAWTLVDQWTSRLALRWWHGDRSTDLRHSLVVVALVCAVMVWRGIGAGVVVGVVVSGIAFIRTLNRQVVRSRYSAADFPSRRIYDPADEAALQSLRTRIGVLELEGALFFGTADRLTQEGGATDGLTDLVVDLRRITTIDASGAIALAQLAQALAARGVTLRLAGVRLGGRHADALLAHGVPLSLADAAAGEPRGLPGHADLDRAIEAAELDALRSLADRRDAPAVPLAACRLFTDLEPSQVATLEKHLRQRRLAAGEALFREGEPGVALYILTEGSISVVDAKRGQRFATLSPGMCFGETALLDGGGRTADAVADRASTVHELSRASLDELRREDPALAAQLYLNLSRHLSERLRSASAAWRREAH